MTAIGDLLFFDRSGIDLDAVLRGAVDGMRGKVFSMPESQFAAMSDAEVAETVASTARFVPLEVDFSSAKSEVQETTITVNDYGTSVTVQGLRALKKIPYSGRRQLWNLKTNPWGMNPPRADVGATEITIGIVVSASEGDRAKSYIDDSIARIPEYLDRQKAQIERHNDSLIQVVMPWVQQRRATISAAEKLRKSLG